MWSSPNPGLNNLTSWHFSERVYKQETPLWAPARNRCWRQVAGTLTIDLGKNSLAGTKQSPKVCVEESGKSWHLRSVHSPLVAPTGWVLLSASGFHLGQGRGIGRLYGIECTDTTSSIYQLPHHWQAMRPFCAPPPPVSSVKWREIAVVSHEAFVYWGGTS